MSFLLFALGALLTLLAVTKNLSALVVTAEYRALTVALGVLLLVGAVALYVLLYLRKQRQVQSDIIAGERANDSSTWETKLIGISSTQRRVLRTLAEATWAGDAVEEEVLRHQLSIPAAELFYRLEQLRLLGFAERVPLSRTRHDTYAYRLTADYRRLLGEQSDTPHLQEDVTPTRVASRRSRSER